MWKLITKESLEQTKQEFASGGKEMQWYAMANEVLLTTLGTKWWKINCVHPYQGDEYLRTNGSEEDNYEFQHRIIYLGHMLYALRNCKGFKVFIKALKTRDLKSCFWELNTAWILFDNGYKVVFIRPTGVKRKDYDLEILEGGYSFVVESKARDKKERFSLKTLKNTFRDALRQLPKNKNGVIFISAPLNLNEKYTLQNIEKCLNDFFRRTSRVVYIVLVWKQWKSLEKGKKLTTFFKKFNNTFVQKHPSLHLKKMNTSDESAYFQPSFYV